MAPHYPRSLDEVKELGLGLTIGGRACLDIGMAPSRISPSDIVAISHRLSLTRRALKLKKSEFAARAGISRTAYHNWEPKDGKPPVGRPNVDEATRLCEAYGLTLDWIYRGEPSRLPHDLAEAIAAIEREKRRKATGTPGAQIA